MTQQPWPQYAPPPPPPPPRRNRAVLFVALGLVAALVIAGVVTVVLVLSDSVDRSAASDTGPTADEKFATTRDDALAAGEEIVVAFNTVDYQTVDEDLDTWESLSTGDLLTEVKDNRESAKQAVVQAKSKSTAAVLAAALSELDVQKGTARMIAAVRVGVTQNGLEPTEKRIRMQLTLQKTGSDWKVSEIGKVPVS